MHIFEKLVYSTINSVIITDNKLKITFANEGWVYQTGYNVEESIGKNPMELLSDDIKPFNKFSMVNDKIKQRKPFQIDVTNYKKNGESYNAHLDVTPFSLGGSQGWLCFSTDITPYQLKAKRSEFFAKNLVKELKTKQNSLDSYAETITELSHDLRNLIHKISGNLEILKMEQKDICENPQLVNALVSLDTAMNMLEEIIRLNKLDHGQTTIDHTEVDLNTELKNYYKSIEYLLQNKNIKCVLELPEEKFVISTNKTSFLRIIENIVSNAIKYTPNNGEIRIKLEEGVTGKHLTITDNGVGMTSATLAKLFDKYSRGESHEIKGEKGFGLGMSIVEKLCNSLDIRINISSAIKSGTQVKLSF